MSAGTIDREALLAELDGDGELLADLVETMRDEAPKLLHEVRAAVDSGDASRVARAAHTLKGAVSNFAARSVADAALQLERIWRSGDLASAKPALAVLETEMLEFEKALGAL